MKIPASLRQEYERLSTDRSPYLQRARDCSKYTIPTLVPQQGTTGGRKLRSGYSNFGARCVNSLSAKLLLAVLPARQSFFRLTVTDDVLRQMGGTKLRAEVEKALGSMEQVIQADIESTNTRTPTGEGIKHLLVAGNVLLHVLPSGGVKVYPLHSFVCHRDGEGSVLSIIAVDKVSPSTLPDSVRGAVKAKLIERSHHERTIEVYTGIFRQGNHWKVYQEVEGIMIPESQGHYPLDASPWLPLRWTPVDGESYGRSMVEDYLGYFISLEALTAALVKGTAVAAKVVYLRNPNGVTKAAAVTRAETGDVVDGRIEDINALQSQKAQDFSTTRQMIADLKEELAYAFALNQAIQRNAERVTAEEIKFMAQELDSTLGGHYSTFSLEFQQPFLRRKMVDLERQGKLPALPKRAIRPVIVTGLDALGRGAELDNLRAFVRDVVELGGPQALETYLDFGDLLKRLATSRAIQSDGLVKDPAQVAAELQQKQMQQMIQHLGPNAINQAGQLVKTGMAPSPQGN
ncbi:MAG: portal protein [Aquabacterium sp.]